MRRFVTFDCAGDRLAGTLDTPGDSSAITGLLIVSGGNEIRAGAHAGQAALAAWLASEGYPSFRYDRPGVGDSEGENKGFDTAIPALEAALSAFRGHCPALQKIVAYGNCDAATLLMLAASALPVDRLLLSNPWLYETETDDADENAPLPSGAAIKARYLARLKDPVRLARDLASGAIDFGKLGRGLARIGTRQPPSLLAERVAARLSELHVPTNILLATGDATALNFREAWRGATFEAPRANAAIALEEHTTGSHSFADESAQSWFRERTLAALEAV